MDPAQVLHNLTTKSALEDDIGKIVSNLTTQAAPGDDEKAGGYILSQVSKEMESYVLYRIGFALEGYIHPVLACVGIIVNVLALCVLLQPAMRRFTTCLYMAVISFLDTLILGMSLFFWTYKSLDYQIFSWVCKLTSFLFYFLIHLDVAVLVSMTTEKYICIKYPLKSRLWCVPRRVVMIVTTLIIFFALLHLHNFWSREYVFFPKANLSFCSSSHERFNYFLGDIHPWMDATLYSFIPFTMLSILNILTLRAARKAFKGNSQMTAKGDENQTNKNRKMNAQITRMLLLVSFTFLFLTTPISAMLIAESFWDYQVSTRQMVIHSFLRQLVNTMMFANHAVNFWLYFFSGTRFRRQFFEFFTKKAMNRPVSGASISTSVTAVGESKPTSGDHKVSK